MSYQSGVLWNSFFEWLLFSTALFLIADKLKWEEKWKAWIPGLRFYCLGESVGMSSEGMFCGIMDLLFSAAAVTEMSLGEGQFAVLAALVYLVLFVFLFVYRIRIFLEILHIFGLGKKWVLLWLIANWLPLMIFGVGEEYQPRKGMLRERDREAGEGPAGTPEGAAGVDSHEGEGLCVRIRERTVTDFGEKRYLLKDIALDIPKSSLVLLLGGSGSGKTTLINAMIGYEQADATVLLNGADVYREYDSVRHKIGFVPQQNLIRGKDTVIDTVGDAADLRLPTSVSKEERKERIGEVMGLLGLSAGQQGLVSKKSGGQLRRICIAMELITDPELFVLDEPDSGLDGAISREIFCELRQIADEGRIVIVVTHTPDRVIDLFDRVIVLARDSARVGRLAFFGSPGEAREFFGKETMEQIVMCVNGREEGGEGRADEMIGKYAALAAAGEGGRASWKTTQPKRRGTAAGSPRSGSTFGNSCGCSSIKATGSSFPWARSLPLSSPSSWAATCS